MIGVLRTDLVSSIHLATSGISGSVSPPRPLAMGRSPVRGRGYSYYTTCMIGINSVGKITYNDLYPAAYDPNRSYVVSLVANGQGVDLMPPPIYWVSTVNYLAAGSCNFNDGGVGLWPLGQITNSTQYCVRDAVIDYVAAIETVSPAINGRLIFIYDIEPPVITINSPQAAAYMHPGFLTLNFSATGAVSGVRSVWADLDGTPVTDGQD